MHVAKPLPVFKNPPITEVVCGITFRPLKSLLAPHLGLYWVNIRSNFPTCREVEPLVPVVESFDEAQPEQQDLSVALLPRIWFVSKDQNGIIQIQRDRFLQNWRKVRPTDEYPRYESVRADFDKNLQIFNAFLAENQLGTIELIQLELTYINHIFRGSGWEHFGHLSKVFPDFAWRSGNRFLADPERINWRTSFVLPDKAGRMHVSIQNAIRRSDQTPLFLFELTVRGIHNEKTFGEMWKWFDTAREWIVRGFADLTGPDMHKSVWFRTE